MIRSARRPQANNLKSPDTFLWYIQQYKIIGVLYIILLCSTDFVIYIYYIYILKEEFGELDDTGQTPRRMYKYDLWSKRP